MIQHLRARSASTDEWIRNTVIRSHSPEMTLVEDIPKDFQKTQTHKCLHCGEQSHFKRNYKENQTNFKKIANAF